MLVLDMKPVCQASIVILFLLTASLAAAQGPETNSRTWTSADGSKSFEGQYVATDESGAMVTIRRGENEATYPAALFSKEDQEWLAKMAEFEEARRLGFTVKFKVLQVLPNGLLAKDFKISFSHSDEAHEKMGRYPTGTQFVRIETEGRDFYDGKAVEMEVAMDGTFKYRNALGAEATVRSWKALSELRREMLSASSAE